MDQTADTPKHKGKRELVFVCAADIKTIDYSKLAAIIPGAIRFQVTYGDEVRDIYDLPLSRCRNYKEILGWTHHLAPKLWVTPGLLCYFIHLACKANGIKFPLI